MTSLPVPDSPCRHVVTSVPATRVARLTTSLHAADVPMGTSLSRASSTEPLLHRREAARDRLRSRASARKAAEMVPCVASELEGLCRMSMRLYGSCGWTKISLGLRHRTLRHDAPSRSMVSPSPSTALQPALLHVRGHVGARVRSPRSAHMTSDRIDRVRYKRCEHVSNRRLRVVMTSGGTLSAHASRESPPKWIWRVFCCVPVRVACGRGLIRLGNVVPT
jgi:hypothetical protein